MIPEATVRHALPGRIRLRIAAMRRDRAYFDDLSQSLQATQGIRTVTASPVTGSVMVTGPAATPARLRKIGREQDLFSLVTTASDRAGGPPASDRKRTLDRMAMMMVGLAFIQTLRGQVMVPALALIWYAMELIRWEDEDH